MKTPAVSICIPAYNMPEMLKRAIKSIFAQDFQDFELIISDDSTTDTVAEVVAHWSNDPRVTYLRNAPSLGSPENWNAALRLAKAPLIKFMHHDDWFLDTTALKQFVETMQNNPNVTLTFSACNNYAYDGSLLRLHQVTHEQIEQIKSCPALLQFVNIIGAPSTTIFRNTPGFLFDRNLIWVVDVDAYLCLLKDTFVLQYISSPLVGISNGDQQITAHLENAFALKAAEQFYLYTKHTPKSIFHRKTAFYSLKELLFGLNIVNFKLFKEKRKKTKTTPEEVALVTLLSFKQKFKSIFMSLSKFLSKS